MNKTMGKPILILKNILSFFTRHTQSGIVSLLFILTAIVFGNFLISFKFAIIIFALATLLLHWLTKNLLLSTAVIAIFTLPLFSPNKLYPVVTIQRDVLSGPLSVDHIQSYGLFLPNIFLFLSFLSLIATIIKREVLLRLFHKNLVKYVFLAFFAFFFSGLYSSLQHSPFFSLSFSWLILYTQFILVAFLIFALYVLNKKKFFYIYNALSVSLLLESTLIAWQFIKQGSVNLLVESRLSSGLPLNPDANPALFRPSGTFLYPNQAALLLLINLIFLYPYMAKRPTKLSKIACIIAIAAIILTQSRTVWFLLIIVGMIFLIRHGKTIAIQTALWGKKKFILFVFLLLTGFLFIFVPRMLLLDAVFYEHGAIPTRLTMINEGLTALSQSPLFGYGIGTNEYVLYLFNPNGVMRYFPAPIHMGYLQLALEAGIVGLGAFLFTMYVVLRKILSFGHQHRFSNFSLSFLCGLFVFSFFYLFHPHVGMFEFAYLGLILGTGLISIYNHDAFTKNG